MTRIDIVAWQKHLKTPLDTIRLEATLKNITWTSALADDWQEFYDTAQRVVGLYRGGRIESYVLSDFPKYQDLPVEPCSP